MEIPSKEFIEQFKETKGAFSVTECIGLYNIVLQGLSGDYLELGSHRGKSSQVIAKAMPSASTLILVEPEFESQEWMNDVLSKVVRLIPENGIEWIAGYSLNVIPKYDALAFCFVDSGIHDDMVMDEVKLLEDRMIPDGIIAFHDYLNQFTAVERAYNYLVSTGKYESIAIQWDEIINYVRDNNLEEGNNSWHIYEENPFPNFVGAVRRK